MAKPARRPRVGRPPLGADKRDQMIRPLFTRAELAAIKALIKQENAERIIHPKPATWLRELALGQLERAKELGRVIFPSKGR